MTTPPPPAPRRSVAEAAAVGLAVLLAYIVLRATELFLVGAFNDDGVYIALGKAIADGTGYRLSYLVGEPVAVRYPPGLPALLAIPWHLTGTLAGVRATVEVLHPLLAALAAGMLWWLGRERLGLSRPVLAVCAIGPFLLEPAIQYYNIALSEPYLLAGWATALALVARLDGDTPAGQPGTAAALGATLAVTALFRAAALALLPAVLMALMLRRRRPRDVALCAVAAVVPLALWQLAHGAMMARGPLPGLPDETPYWQWLSVAQPAQVLSSNVVAYLQILGSYVLGGHAGAVAAMVLVAALAVLGGVRWARAQAALVLSVAASLLAVLIWPWAQDRLVLPILPFAGLLAAGFVERTLSGATAVRRRAVYALLGGFTLVAALRQNTLRRVAEQALATGATPAPADVSPRYVLARNSRYIFHLARWVRANTAPQDRIVANHPAALFLYTGRRAVAGSPAEAAFAPSIFADPGRYLAVRILEDSVTIVALGILGGGLHADIDTIRARCPSVLDPSDRSAAPRGGPAMFYRVRADERCLRDRVIGGGSSP